MSLSSNQTLAKKAVSNIQNQDLSIIDSIWAEDYIQNSGNKINGRDEITKTFKMLIEKGMKPQVIVVRTIAEDNLVVTHSRISGLGPKPMIMFNIFRINKEGLLAEHTSIGQPEAAETVSGRTQIDGQTESKDLEKTAENKALLEKFYDDVLYSHKMDLLPNYISTETYNQHNPGVGDGLASFAKVLADLVTKGLTMEYRKTHLFVAQGDMVFAYSEGIYAGKNVYFADLFRIENGKIVEHWDTIEEIKA